MKYCNTIGIIGLLLLWASPAIAQNRQDTIERIEKVMSRYLPQNPGCQLSVKKNGAIIFSKAYGMADLEHNGSLTTQSLIEAGSVSKQFTAAAILLLEQQGRLNLQDDVRKYIPEIPDYGTKITLRHLISHTSGLKDWGAIAALAGWERTTKTYSNDDALEIICRQKKLNNVPGAEFIYSNSNYNLLAIIVQRVSGLSLAEFSKKYIFTPAGMSQTQWRDNHKRIVKNRAMAYALTNNGFETEMPNEDVYGNGGLLTTTEELLRWNDFYSTGMLGTASLVEKQTELSPFNNGFMNNYAAGLFIQTFKGWKHISHSGATASYRANLDFFPELNLSIAWLSNSSQFDTASINLPAAIRNIFVARKEEKTTDAPKDQNEERVYASDPATFSGWYKNNRDGSGVRIEVRENDLVIKNKKLFPQSRSSFRIEDSKMCILFNKKGGFTMVIPDTDSISYSKVSDALQDNATLKAYSGTYTSAETNSSFTLMEKNGSLWIHIKPGKDFPLEPTYKDAFEIKNIGGHIFFTRNEKNKLTGGSITVSRARNIFFNKIK